MEPGHLPLVRKLLLFWLGETILHWSLAFWLVQETHSLAADNTLFHNHLPSSWTLAQWRFWYYIMLALSNGVFRFQSAASQPTSSLFKIWDGKTQTHSTLEILSGYVMLLWFDQKFRFAFMALRRQNFPLKNFFTYLWDESRNFNSYGLYSFHVGERFIRMIVPTDEGWRSVFNSRAIKTSC